MQKRLVGIVLCLVGVVAVVALLWRTLLEPPMNAPFGGEASLAPRAAMATALEASAGPSDDAMERLPGAASSPASPSADAEDLSVIVRVVDGVTEQPVPGAKVHYWDEAAWAERSKVPADSPLRAGDDEEDWLLALGRIAHCDERGETAIRTSYLGDVLAEFEGAIGVGRVEQAGELRIAIRPERSVALRLLTVDRRPVVGVEVGVWALDAAGVPECDFPMRRQLTDKSGVARFRHLQWPQRFSPALRDAALCAVRPSLPGCGALFATFSPTAEPGEPIELTLPPCGSFVVRWPAGVDPAKTTICLREAGECWAPNTCAPATPRELVFENVPIGRRYEFEGVTRTQVDGPTYEGEVVVVEMAAEPSVSLTGILHDVEGKVLAECECDLVLRAGSWFRPVTLHTDGSGRFVHTVPSGRSGWPFRCLIHVRAEGARGLLGTAAVDGVLVGGVNELGTLRAIAVEPLVAGRVLRQGDGLSRKPGLLVEWFDPESERWWKLEGLHTTVLESGFAIFGSGPKDRSLRLRCAGGATLVGGPRSFVPGERDVLLEVRMPVSFEARARYDAALVPHVEVALIPIDLPAAELASLGLRPGAAVPIRGIDLLEDQALYQDEVPAGTYDLVFRIRGFPDVLARVDRVVVGGERPDPRLLEIDLRGKLATLVVDVVDGNGEAQQGRITALGVADLGEGRRLEFSSGETLLVPAGPRDLLVFWPDYPPVEVRAAIGRVRVEVAPWRSQEFVVAGLPSLPSGFSYWIEVGDGQPRDWSKLESYQTCIGDESRLENGRARVQIGDQRTSVRLRITRESDWETVSLSPVQPDRVAPDDTPIELKAPSAEAILAALAALQAKPLR